MKLQDYAAAIPEGLWEMIHVPTINPPTEQFDQFIQQKLFDYTAPVSPEIWNRIKPKRMKIERYSFYCQEQEWLQLRYFY